eukprot:COSAG01_NODE_724_length_14056_cov_41.795443_3_plen_75_part_00
MQIDLGQEIHSYDVRLTLLLDDDDDDDDDDTIAGAHGGLSVGGWIPSVSAARLDWDPPMSHLLLSRKMRVSRQR